MVAERVSKDDYYLGLAAMASSRGTCTRRNYGAVIVSVRDAIVATGYSGAPRGWPNCNETGRVCPRTAAGCPSGEGYELCCSVHAEQNAIIQAGAADMDGATMYVYGFDSETVASVDMPEPCTLCRRMIVNARIARVVIWSCDGLREIDPATWAPAT